MLSDQMSCSYTQRRLVSVEDGCHTDSIVQADHLHSLLFQPIAGDSASRLDSANASFSLALSGMQFGILDVESINRLSVVKIKLASVAEAPECLGDLRMGASGGGAIPRASLCETCHMTHHNCPGHFEPQDLYLLDRG